jgi:hypothetical protein
MNWRWWLRWGINETPRMVYLPPAVRFRLSMAAIEWQLAETARVITVAVMPAARAMTKVLDDFAAAFVKQPDTARPGPKKISSDPLVITDHLFVGRTFGGRP